MKKYNNVDWSYLLSNYAISGDLKIECIKKLLSLNLNPRHQRVILEEIKTQLEYHKKDKGMDYFAYRWLENHYHHLKENPSSISKKTKWEVEIEKPLINLFKNLKVKFQFSNSLQHKKTVVKNYKNWDILLRDDYFIKVLDFVNEEIENLNNRKTSKSLTIENNSNKSKQLTFGFKGDINKLKTVVNLLCNEIDLLNEDISKAADLIKIFTTKNILPALLKIQLDCETKHFRYCIDKFSPYFNNLSLANIEKTKIFYSKKDRPITANNLSASGSKNKIEPKKKTTIDKIFKHLQ